MTEVNSRLSKQPFVQYPGLEDNVRSCFSSYDWNSGVMGNDKLVLLSTPETTFIYDLDADDSKDYEIAPATKQERMAGAFDALPGAERIHNEEVGGDVPEGIVPFMAEQYSKEEMEKFLSWAYGAKVVELVGGQFDCDI